MRTLFRAILRAGRLYDRDKALRILLSAARDIEYDLISATGSYWAPMPPPDAPPQSAADIEVSVASAIVRSVCDGARMHGPCASPDGAVQRALSRELRTAIADYGTCSTDQQMDAAFRLLRRLETGAGLAEQHNLLHPIPPELTLAGTMPPLPPLPPPDPHHGPVAGDLLASHPLLRRDVVVLLSASGADGFAFGVVINEPTMARVAGGALLGGRGAGQPNERRSATGWTTGRRMLEDALSPHRQVRDDSLAVFAQHPIFAGGPDGTANVTMLHPHSHVRGCVEVRPGLCFGGDLAHAADLVRARDASADDFVFFKGRVDFRPGELAGELQLGEWSCASTVGLPCAWPPPGLHASSHFGAGGSEGTEGTEGVEGVEGPRAQGAVSPRRLAHYRYWSWARVVSSMARGRGFTEDNAPWLRLRTLTQEQADEIGSQVAVRTARSGHAIHGSDDPGAPPLWRAREGVWWTSDA